MDYVLIVNKNMPKQTDAGLFNKIISLKSFRPSKETNQVFSKLVSYTLNPKNSISITKTQINKLQKMCSESEYELEKYWANKIINADDPKDALSQFPYYSNYTKLTQLEWHTLLSCSHHNNHNVVFAGGGPLPLTAIVMVKNYVKKVTVLEVDKTAYNLSLQLVKKLGLSKKVTIVNTDAASFKDYSKFNVIVVAALAGVNKNAKIGIFHKIKKESSPESHILARSSSGLREMLYRPIDKSFYKMFKPVVEVHPQNDVVNSVIVFSNA